VFSLDASQTRTLHEAGRALLMLGNLDRRSKTERNAGELMYSGKAEIMFINGIKK